MGIEYTTQVGYGYVVDFQPKYDDLDLYEMEEKIYDKLDLEHFSIAIVGSSMTGENMRFILFVDDESLISSDEDELAGAFEFGQAPEFSEEALKELKKLKKFLVIEEDEPSVIAGFSIS